MVVGSCDKFDRSEPRNHSTAPTYAYTAINGPTMNLDTLTLMVEINNSCVAPAVEYSVNAERSMAVCCLYETYHAHGAIGTMIKQARARLIKMTRKAICLVSSGIVDGSILVPTDWVLVYAYPA